MNTKVLTMVALQGIEALMRDRAILDTDIAKKTAHIKAMYEAQAEHIRRAHELEAEILRTFSEIADLNEMTATNYAACVNLMGTGSQLDTQA